MTTDPSGTVNTVLGPVNASELGIIATHDALLSVYPGAQYAYDIEINRADIFATLKHKLEHFKAVGGGAIVDSTGMFHGRDVYLYESLQQATGVNIIASTGQGPEALLGGYFLTPQTNPPTPWPAEKFADLFAKEVTEGMVVDRIERRASAGLITTTGTRTGLTQTDESLFAGAARAAKETGAPVSFRFGADPIAELEHVLAEGVNPQQVLLAGLDRTDITTDAVLAVAKKGVYVGLDHVGVNNDDTVLTDEQRVELIQTLISAGHADQVILASSSTGYAVAHDANDVALTYLPETFAPQLGDAGVGQDNVDKFIRTNPASWLADKE